MKPCRTAKFLIKVLTSQRKTYILLLYCDRYNGTGMFDHRIGGGHHGGAGLHNGQNQGETGAGETVPGGSGYQNAAG